MVWTAAVRDGMPVIHDHTIHTTASTRVMDSMEDVFRSTSVTHLDRTEDGLLLELRGETTTGGRVETSVIRWTGAGYELERKVAGLTETKSVACPSPLPVDAEAFLAPKIRRGELSAGQKLTYQAANYEARKLETVELLVEAEETIPTPVGRVACWRVVETMVGRPGKSTWWLDTQGVLARVHTGVSVVERTTPEKARKLDPSAAAYTITLPAVPPLPRVTSAVRGVVEVTIRRSEGVELPEFPETPFSKVLAAKDGTFRMELRAHDDPSATTSFPVTDPELAKWLESTNLYSPEHPTVKAAAKRAVDGATDGRAAVRNILRYVFQTLRKGSGPIPQPTAKEILEERMGDCSEHAVLFVALCRSVGIPARRLSGYAQVHDMWGAHAFCEVWLGTWVGADPTTNELGTAARYVAFGWDEDPDSYPGLVSSRCLGRMSIRTLSVTEGGVTSDIAAVIAKDEDDAVRGESLSGLRFGELPRDWSVRWYGNGAGAALLGPKCRAEINISWGMGDMDLALLGAMRMGGAKSSYGGLPAFRAVGRGMRRNTETAQIPHARRLFVVSTRVEDGTSPEDAATLERLVAAAIRGK
ncbi:MAG: hypothetical protein HMLKMBBP_01033 [Planctomycetes bacterium]|nr:hypothetical protein [Planctomycetota bacterium]